MTAVVSYYCSDGVVVAADSMITSFSDDIPLARHTARKLYTLGSQQIFAYSGDQGMGERFRLAADVPIAELPKDNHPIEYAYLVTQRMGEHLVKSLEAFPISIGAVLAFEHNDQHQCAIFDNHGQPRLMDDTHFLHSMGSGQGITDPFLLYLNSVFCPEGPPTVKNGIFLAIWTLEHVINTNPGGVHGPVRVGVLERDKIGSYSARELFYEETEFTRLIIDQTNKLLPGVVEEARVEILRKTLKGVPPSE